MSKAVSMFLIICALFIMLLTYTIGLPEMGFSLDYIMSDYPLIDRIMYLFVRFTLVFAPLFFIIIGLHTMGKGPWVPKEIELEPDRIVFRRKDGKEQVLYEIEEAKPYRLGLQIRGRTSAGKQVTKPVLRASLGDEEFAMFKSDLERLYGVKV
nr:MAG: hypothetical protein AM325_15860 [Candidatus Thorarchaeota archaeon SMTZ1-45]